MRAKLPPYFVLLLLCLSLIRCIQCIDHRSGNEKRRNSITTEDYPVHNNVTSHCVTCVTSGANLFDFNGGNVCISTSESSCPDFHRCCDSVECCVTDGCRSPTDIFYIETEDSDISQRCNQCQDGELTFSYSSNQTYVFGNVSYVLSSSVGSDRNICQYRWDYQGTGWYDTVTQAACVTTYEYPPRLPKCATCTHHLHSYFLAVLQQLPSSFQCDPYTCSSYDNSDIQSCDGLITTCECFCHVTYISRMACPQLTNYAQNYFNNTVLALNTTYREGNATLKNASTSEQLQLETESYDDFNISTDLQGNATLKNASATRSYQSSNDNSDYPSSDKANVEKSSQRDSDGSSNKLANQHASGGISAMTSVAVITVSISVLILLSLHTAF